MRGVVTASRNGYLLPCLVATLDGLLGEDHFVRINADQGGLILCSGAHSG